MEKKSERKMVLLVMEQQERTVFQQLGFSGIEFRPSKILSPYYSRISFKIVAKFDSLEVQNKNSMRIILFVKCPSNHHHVNDKFD